MPVTFPTKFDVREARDQANKVVGEVVDPFRAPALALLAVVPFDDSSSECRWRWHLERPGSSFASIYVPSVLIS